MACGTFNYHVIFIRGANKYKLSAIDGKIIHLSDRKHSVDMTTGETDITLISVPQSRSWSLPHL